MQTQEVSKCFPGHSAGREWLQKVSDKFFKAWLQSKEGRAWLKKGDTPKRKSPYYHGFFLPAWFEEAIDALNKNNEEKFKAIKMVEGMYL